MTRATSPLSRIVSTSVSASSRCPLVVHRPQWGEPLLPGMIQRVLFILNDSISVQWRHGRAPRMVCAPLTPHAHAPFSVAVPWSTSALLYIVIPRTDWDDDYISKKHSASVTTENSAYVLLWQIRFSGECQQRADVSTSPDSPDSPRNVQSRVEKSRRRHTHKWLNPVCVPECERYNIPYHIQSRIVFRFRCFSNVTFPK